MARSRAGEAADGRQRDRSRPPQPAPLGTPVADSHCHLDIQDGDDLLGVPDALAAAAAVGVTHVVQVGVDVDSSRWSVRTASEFERVVAAVALHPNEAPRIALQDGGSALDEAFEEIAQLAAHERVRAIGETGLDHFRTGEEGREWQEYSFRRHLALAKEVGKPVVIHDRDAHDDVVRVLLSEGAPDTVVFHCFSGDADLARVCAEHGWYLSFAGVVTFKNAQGLRDALAVTPLDRVLVETDAPFLTPAPYRGRPNASYLVPLTIRAMAETHEVDEDTLCATVMQNTRRVFGSW